MKRFLTLALSALLAVGLLTACGGTSDGSADTAEVSLSSFYAGLAEEYGWTEDAASSGEEDILMMDVEGDLLESYYPGLADVATERAFFQSWVRREARSKRSGTGIGTMLASESPLQYGEQFYFLETFPGYVAGVATRGGGAPGKVRKYSLDEMMA